MYFHSLLGFPLLPHAGAPADSLTGRSARIGEAVRSMGFATFDRLCAHVAGLPYGRPTSIGDPLDVLREGRGTSGAKHLLLAMVAQGCGRFDVMLTVGVYAMSEANTPGVGETLATARVDSIAHTCCYLTFDHERLDYSGAPRGKASRLSALSAEYFLTPDVMVERRQELHRQALAGWAQTHGMSSEEAWRLVEACRAARTGVAPLPDPDR